MKDGEILRCLLWSRTQRHKDVRNWLPVIYSLHLCAFDFIFKNFENPSLI